MKKLACFLLAAAMVFSLAACGGGSNTTTAPAGSTAATQGEATTTKAADGYKYTGPVMTIGGADSSGTMYAAAVAIGTAFTNHIDGMNCQGSTSTGSNENALKVATGEIELGMCTGDAASNCYNGKGKFAESGAHDNLRYIGCVYASTMNWIVLKSSGYTYLHDLAGKGAAVGTGPSASSTETVALLTLEAAGVTDYKGTPCTLGDAATGVADGVYVAGAAYAGAPVSAQLTVSTTKDCVWLALDDNEINWLIEKNPAYTKSYIQPNTYTGQTEAVQTIGVKAGVICAADMDEELAYQLAKCLYENAAELVKGNAFFGDLNDVSFLVDYTVPLHPGAERFYKEVGLLK